MNLNVGDYTKIPPSYRMDSAFFRTKAGKSGMRSLTDSAAVRDFFCTPWARSNGERIVSIFFTNHIF